MGQLFLKNKNVKYLSCVTDVFTKYTWVKPFKEKNDKTVLKDFIKIVNESNHKPIIIIGWSKKRIFQSNFARMVRK